MTLDTQLITMISMTISGLYVGFATETYRRLSVAWKNRRVFMYLSEISYWLLQTCILFYVLYQVNNGEMRVYIFLTCLFGYSVYVVLFRSVYKRVLEIIIKIVVAMVEGLIKAVYTLFIQPMIWIVQALITVFLFFLQLLYWILKIVLYVLLYPLRILLSILKKLIPEKVKNKITKLARFCSTIIYKFKQRVKSLIGRRR